MATIWLAATNGLILYIHPRYVVFTVVMALLALIITLSSVLLRRTHDHPETLSRSQNVLSAAAVVVTLAIAAAMVIVPPATLTSATAAQRNLNSGPVDPGDTSAQDAAASGASRSLSVRDWSALLRQTTDPAFFADKPVDVVGFVTEDPSDPDNLFFVSRFVVTCCAVDAQPVGVPVYLPGWKSSHDVDAWVHVTGTFGVDPSTASDAPIALLPDTVKKVTTPDDPYLF